MSKQAIVEVVAGIVVLVLGAIGVSAWRDHARADAKMAATNETEQAVIAKAQQTEQQANQQLNAALAEIEKLKETVKTPQEIVKEIPQYIQLPQPITLEQPTPAMQKSAANDVGAASPKPATGQESQPVAVVPAADLKPLYDYVQDCRECQAKLSAAQANSRNQQIEIAALTKERDATLQAEKGGGFWHRLKTAGKWLAIGAAAGAVLARK